MTTLSSAAQAAQNNSRNPDGTFGTQVHAEPTEVTLGFPEDTVEGDCSACLGLNDLDPATGRCGECSEASRCTKCGEEYDPDGDGYDGKCPSCADQSEYEDEDDDDTVCVFDHGDARVQIDHRGEENYSLYDEDTNDHILDFSYEGDPEDHHELEAKALRYLKAESHDLSFFDEADRPRVLALYQAGLEGELEPYNGDYPVEDGALRYWNEDVNREIVIGTIADGHTVVAMDAQADDPVRFQMKLGANPTEESIRDAVLGISSKVMAADLPDLDED